MEIQELKQQNKNTKSMLEVYRGLYARANERNVKLRDHRSKTIGFTDDDLLLGTTSHYEALYVTGSINGYKIDRIMIDPGSSVNIIPAWLLESLGLEKHISNNQMGEIHGFNRSIQEVIGIAKLELAIGGVVAKTELSVVEMETSFAVLLGRPWLHDNKVVPSTLHQCMKYIKDGQEIRIDGNIKLHDAVSTRELLGLQEKEKMLL